MTLEWDPNSETNLRGYRVYTGRQSRVYDSVLDVGNQTLAQLTTAPGTTYYAVTAYDADGLESDFSDEVFYTAPTLNTPPAAQPDLYVTTRNATLNVPVAGGVLANDSDVDGDALTVLLATSPVHGTVSLSANGSFNYTPAQDFVGTDSFSYRASDGQATSAAAVVTITVNTSPNVPPATQPEQYITLRNLPLNIAALAGVLANDSDANGDGLAALLVTPPGHGTLSLNADGSFNYTPAQNFVGSDAFSYQATDGNAASAVTVVTITVNTAPNSPPTTQPDHYTATRNVPLNISAIGGVLANDSDTDGDALTALLVTPPGHGTLSLNANGSFNYTPALNFTGTDSFSYRASDGQTTPTVAIVTITVNAPPNVPPTAQPDQYTALRNLPLNIAALAGVLANDSDTDGDALTALLVTPSVHGTVSLSANGSFNYAPAQNFVGTDSFSYRASDGQATSTVAVVTITVNAPPNVPPTAQPDQYIALRNLPLNIATLAGVLANDSDADGDGMAALLVTPPGHGTLSFNADGSFNYTPAQNFVGSDAFSYQATDGNAASAVTVVTITVNTSPNSPPTTQPDHYTATRNVPLNISAIAGVLANDSDADSDGLIALLAASATHGTLSLNANGSFNYTPALNFTGTDSFSYRASDGQATSTVAVVTITVNTPPNSPPTTQPDNYIAIRDLPINISALAGVLANDSDADGDGLAALLVTPPGHGTLSFNADGSFNYAPAQNFVGSDSFSYRATDGNADSAVTVVTITVNTSPNSPPTTQPDQYTATRNVPLNIAAIAGVLANDSDADGDGLVALLAASAIHGTLSLNANGSFNYMPEQNFTGTDSFSYRATDGKATSDVTVVTMTVSTPPNSPPTAQPDQYIATQNVPLNIAAISGVLANDSDADGDELAALLVAPPVQGTLSLNPDGSFNYTPAQDFVGSDVFSYRATDGPTTSAVTIVTFTVNTSPNSPPTAQPDHYTATRNIPLHIAAIAGVLANDSDADGDVLVALLDASVTQGTLSLNGNGSFNYTPAQNFTGTDSFSYRATDGKATSAVTVVTMTVSIPPNSPPTTQPDQYIATQNVPLGVPALAGVLANDSDADGDGLAALLVAPPGHGTLSLNADGSFNYAPAQNFVGSDAFSYRATDGNADSAMTVVTITVNTSPNSPPTTQPDQYTATRNVPLNIAAIAGVLANDSDADGDGLVALLAASVTHGTLSLNANGSFNYTPAPNFTGTDSFSYRANDGKAPSDVTVVTMTVNSPPNSPPATQPDQYIATQNVPLNIAAISGVLANDSDADGDELAALLVTPPGHGTLSFDFDGSFHYAPAQNFVGSDSFSYQATDGSADSAVTVVTITVNTSPNSPPTTQPDQYIATKNVPLNIAAIAGVLANDSDADGDGLLALLAASATHGTLSLNANGSFDYMPVQNFTGTDSFSYRATDGKATSAVTVVTMTVNAPPNSPPATQPDHYIATQNVPLNIAAISGVLANDSDADGDELAALLVTPPGHGTLLFDFDGSFNYAPAQNFVGSDSFSYRATDGHADSAVTVVTLTVNTSPNSAPTTQPDLYVATRNTPLNIAAIAGVLANDSDADGDGLVALLAASVSHGTLLLNANGSFNYTPAQNFTGTDSFSYRATDGKTNSGVTAVTITVNREISLPPTTQPDQYATTRNGTLTVSATGGVLANDASADGDVMTAVLVASAAHGTLSLNANGSFNYTPAQNFVGSDFFSYRASDVHGTSAMTIATILVNPAPNSPPTAQPEQYGTMKNVPLIVSAMGGVLANDRDADGDALAAVLVTSVAYGALAFNADGSFVYSPAQDFTGTDSFSYRASDGNATSTVAVVVITLTDSPPNTDCASCFAALDAVLAARSNAFASVIAARAAVPTNGTCLQSGVLALNALSRSLHAIHDTQADDALALGAECLIAGLRNELTARSAAAAALPPSTWTKAASNRIAVAVRKLDGALSSSDQVARARLAAVAAASLAVIDRMLASGELAPASLANKRLAWAITKAGRRSDFWFTFGEQSFSVEIRDGTPVGTGNYAFTRTAWNAGSLVISFDNDALGFTAGEIYNVDLKFSNTRSRIIGKNIRSSK